MSLNCLIKGAGIIGNSLLLNYLLWLSYYIFFNHYLRLSKISQRRRTVFKKDRFCRFGRSIWAVEDSVQGSVEWTYLLCSRLCFVILLTFETSRPPHAAERLVAASAFLLSHESDARRRRDTSFFSVSAKRLLREQCPPNVLVFYQVT